MNDNTPMGKSWKLTSPSISSSKPKDTPRTLSNRRRSSFSADALNRNYTSLSNSENSNEIPNLIPGGRTGLTMKRIPEATTFEERITELFIQMKEDPAAIPFLNVIFPGHLTETEYSMNITGKLRFREFAKMFCRIVNHRAKQDNVIIIVEGAQWIDVASWELLWDIHINCEEVLIFIFSRPSTHYENQEASLLFNRFKKVPLAKMVTLEGLSIRYTEELVLMQWKKYEPDTDPSKVAQMLLESIHVKTNGSPLYIMSLVLNLFESGACKVDTHGVLRLEKADFDFENVNMGDGMSSIIVAQLDRIDREFQLFLKVASVLGQRFLLDDVMFFLSDTPGIIEKFKYDSNDPNVIINQLRSLDKYGYLCPDENYQEDEPIWLSFKSDIVRKCIYSTMVQAQRQQLHLYVATYYEKMVDDENSERLLVQIYEHYSQTDDTQILKKLRYLEAVSHYYYEMNHMFEAIKHYNLLIMQASEAQKKISLPLYDMADRAVWHLELGDAYYSRGEMKFCEEHLRKAIQLSGQRLSSSGSLFRLLAWKMYIGRSDNWNMSNYRDGAARIQALLKEISDNTASTTHGELPVDEIFSKLPAHYRKSLAVAQANGSLIDMTTDYQDIKQRHIDTIRRSLVVLGQVMFQQGKYDAFSYAVLWAMRLNEKFTPDSFLGRICSMTAMAVWMMRQDEGATLQDLLLGLRLDRKENLGDTIRIVYNTALTLFWMGHWQGSMKYFSSLNELSLVTTNFNLRIEALRMKSFILYMTGPRLYSMGLGKELYNQSVPNNDHEGKIVGHQMTLANLISMPGNKREIKEAMEALKSTWNQCSGANKDPYLELNYLALVYLADLKIGTSVVVGDQLKGLEKIVDVLLQKRQAEDLLGTLGVGRQWTALLGCHVSASVLLSFVDNGKLLTPDDKRLIVRIARKFGRYVKTTEMRFFLLSKPVRYLFKGIKHIFDKDSPTTTIKAWQNGLVRGAPSELISGILHARIAKHAANSTAINRSRHLAEAQRNLKQIGALAELEILK